MLYVHFLHFVKERSGLPEEKARTGIQTVIDVLGERIGSDHIEELSEVLPAELRSDIEPSRWPRPFEATEFVNRVARRQQLDLSAAESLVRAVLSVLTDYFPSPELLHILKLLPEDIRHLFRHMERAA